jgi:triosephosphate isomerase (TIM)
MGAAPGRDQGWLLAGRDANLWERGPKPMVGTIRPLIAGNWKMNGTRATATALVAKLAETLAGSSPRCEVLVCPPATLIGVLASTVHKAGIALGGQDCHSAEAGAHTGDVAAAMLADLGCRYVIVGHSERRAQHGETDAIVSAKAAAAHKAGLTAIICVGETAAEKDRGETIAVISRQVPGSIPDGATASNTIIAYEPVWAIGTGRTPTTGDIAAVHRHIRGLLAAKGTALAGARILYGGSVNAKNADAILKTAEVNGALVGGASLDADGFGTICRACP